MVEAVGNFFHKETVINVIESHTQDESSLLLVSPDFFSFPYSSLHLKEKILSIIRFTPSEFPIDDRPFIPFR